MNVKNKNLCAGNTNGNILVWKDLEKQPEEIVGHSKVVNSLIYHNKKLISGSEDESIIIRDFVTLEVIKIIVSG